MSTTTPTMTGAQLRQHFGVVPTLARQRADAALLERPPGTPGPDGWAYSRTWAWQWTRGAAYRMVNLDWSPDTYAGVVDDFGHLHLVGWSA